MSLPTPETIQCPECGEEFEVTVFQSINDSWPNAVEDIMTGELFRVKCPKCGHEDRLEYDILVNDFGHRAWIQVCHEPELIPVHEKALAINREYMPETRSRIVHNISELRQKLTAFFLGRDDRIIELCKYCCYVFLMRQEPDFKLAWDPVYAANSETKEEAVLFYGENGEEKYTPIGDDLVNAMTKLFEDKATDEDKNRYIYDFAWAEEFTMNMNA